MADIDPARRFKRKPVNLSVREDLIAEARDLGLNVSQVTEHALSDSIAKARAQQWLKENAEAIEKHNERVAQKGLFNEGLRRF